MTALDSANEQSTPPKNNISLTSALMFLAAVGLNIIGVSIWPTTQGFTEFWPSVACSVTQILANVMLGRLLFRGVHLSILLPLASAVIPLAAVVVGVVLYGEPISIVKVALLAGACGMVYAAGRSK